MNTVELIEHKTSGGAWNDSDLGALVAAFTAGRVPEYQMAAALMAVRWRGMTRDEIVALTRAYVDSGRRVDLSGIGRPVVDKHSTGGVGDKTSIVVCPLVASLGYPVGKMSGRGLSFCGGTIDKLESITGLQTALDAGEFVRRLAEVGMVITGQSADLAPADARTYALRDVTATVQSIPLIAASVMSKKIAGGAAAVVLDVKVGRGAFLGDVHDATELARTMREIGATHGITTRPVLTTMDAPLGRAVGCALEVGEAVRALQGRLAGSLGEVVRKIATEMVVAIDPATTFDIAAKAVDHAIASGLGFETFARWVSASGGDVAVLEDLDRLPAAPHVRRVRAAHSGWVRDIDARAIGLAVVELGGGRRMKTDTIDPRVGVVLLREVGDNIERGDPWCELHAASDDHDEAFALVDGALTVGDSPVVARSRILDDARS